MEWADQFYSFAPTRRSAEDALQCVAGNVKQVGSSETGYATFGETNSQFNSLMLADAGAGGRQRRRHDAMRTTRAARSSPILTGTVYDLASDATIKVPIAYVHAGDDGIFQAPLPWPQIQEALYAGSRR